MLAPGVLVERYELVSPIGEGGMASVWAARQHGKHGFEKLVALKVIHSRYAEDPTFRTMFLDEARVVASLVHRNVAQVFDLGDTGELLYIVLEYVDGESLFALTAPQRRVPYAIALRIVAEACAGIAAVHALADPAGVSRNIVHRDVSPQNILLSMSGEVKLIDFGIAKARDRNSKTTDINTVKGKLRYMAPEQAKHLPVGPSTDVFALGAVLFRLLAGMPPYAAPNDFATIQALLAFAPPLNELPDDVPVEVAAIVKQSIAPQASERFLSAKAMKEAIESVLASAPRADVAAWVHQNLSEQGRQRQARLSARLASTPSMRAAAIAATKEQEEKVTRPPSATREMEGRPVPAAPELAANVATAPMMPPLRDPAPSVQHDAPPPPAFMDVRALVAQARSGNIPQTRPATEPHAVPPTSGDRALSPPTPGRASEPHSPPGYDRRIDLAVVPLRAAEAPRWGTAPRIAAFVVVATVLAATLLLAVPLLVRNRAIAAAGAAGFDITVRSAGVGLSGVRLRNVEVRSARAPGFHATIPEVDASFSVNDLRLQSPEIQLEGELVDLEVGLGALLQEDRTKYAGTAAQPRRLAIVNGKLTWNAVPGGAAKTGQHVTADDIALDVESRGVGTEEVKGNIAGTTIQTAQTTFGPWAASLERTGGTVRVRVSFDPPVADGASALFVGGPSVPTELTVKIPRYEWAHLGIIPADLGITTDPTSELELNLSASIPSTAPSSLKLDATIYRLKLPAFRAPLDVHAVGNASGPPGKPLNIDKMNITAGPFTATTTGTITPRDDGVRLDGLFKVTPIGCDKLATMAGGVAAFVQSLGQTTGVFGLNGTLNVSGVVKYDSAAPADASVTWLAKESCGVSIFGL